MYTNAMKDSVGQALFSAIKSFAQVGPLCIFIYELTVLAHFRTYLNRDNLSDNTWVSFSALPATLPASALF